MTRCTLCRRTLLAGERFGFWQTAAEDRPGRAVCGLCEQHAREGGWVRGEGTTTRESAIGLRGSVRRAA